MAPHEHSDLEHRASFRAPIPREEVGFRDGKRWIPLYGIALDFLVCPHRSILIGDRYEADQQKRDTQRLMGIVWGLYQGGLIGGIGYGFITAL